jgi:outer membrane protein assembly factor BamB
VVEGVEGLILSLENSMRLAAAFVLTCTAAAAAQSPPPAMFRGDPAHTGVYPDAGARQFAGLAWRFTIDGAIISTPVVSGSVVYVGGGDGRLYAIDRATGRERWHFQASAAVHSSPAVAAGLVFFGSRDNAFYALHAATGRLAWRLPSGADAPLPWGHESGDVYTSSPTVAGDVVVFGSGAGAVYAVDANTGRVRWQYRTTGRVRGTPAVAGGMVYVGDTDGRLYALGLDTGTLRWRYDVEGHTLNSADFGFDRRTIQSSPAVAGGRVFVGARDGYLYALDAATGKLDWRFDHKVSWVNTSPAVADGVVYAGSSDAQFVHAVDAADGRERWRFTTTGIVWASPAVAGPRLYAATRTGRLYALDRATGEPAWQYVEDGGFFSSPVVADSSVYIGSLGGHLYALRTTGGAPLHRAVYWDDSLAYASWYKGTDLRDHLVGNGFELLDGQALTAFMETRIRDREPSAVVFAMDRSPDAVTREAAQSLLRRYLAAGGRAVWLGLPPLIWSRDVKGADISLKDVRRDRTTALLDVDQSPGNFDAWGVHATDAGVEWGLPRWWQSAWAADPHTVTTVLGLDETGAAASWIKTYGGAGGAFVRLWDVRAGKPDPSMVQFAAEFRPVR